MNFGLAATLAAQALLVSVPNLILVTNYKETRWCAFDSVAPASARADADMSLTVVNAWTSGGQVEELKVIWGPESYDWQVTDTYRFDGWKVFSVERDVGYASVDDRLSQTFTRQGERLVRTRTNDIGEYDPEVAPYADLRKAPFYGLLTRAAAAGDLPDAGLCVRASRPRR